MHKADNYMYKFRLYIRVCTLCINILYFLTWLIKWNIHLFICDWLNQSVPLTKGSCFPFFRHYICPYSIQSFLLWEEGFLGRSAPHWIIYSQQYPMPLYSIYVSIRFTISDHVQALSSLHILHGVVLALLRYVIAFSR